MEKQTNKRGFLDQAEGSPRQKKLKCLKKVTETMTATFRKEYALRGNFGGC